MIEMEDRLFDSKTEEISLEKVDFSNAKKVLEKRRNDSIKYLNQVFVIR